MHFAIGNVGTSYVLIESKSLEYRFVRQNESGVRFRDVQEVLNAIGHFIVNINAQYSSDGNHLVM